MSNAQLPARVLRPQADGSLLVLIDTYRELTPEQRAREIEELGYIPEWEGRRPLGEPVAVIQPSPITYVNTGGAPFQMFEIKGDDTRRFLTAGHDPIYLAKRLADGEFDDDFRFEILRNPQPDSPTDLYLVKTFATPSQQETEFFSTDDPYGAVEAARYCQAVPLEERWAQDAEEGR